MAWRWCLATALAACALPAAHAAACATTACPAGQACQDEHCYCVFPFYSEDPAFGVPALCFDSTGAAAFDECHVHCQHATVGNACENGACSADYRCVDHNATVASLGDWVCRCHYPYYSAHDNQTHAACVDSSVGDVFDECGVYCALDNVGGVCENGMCAGAEQACMDPNTDGLAIADWECRCVDPMVGVAETAVAMCRHKFEGVPDAFGTHRSNTVYQERFEYRALGWEGFIIPEAPVPSPPTPAPTPEPTDPPTPVPPPPMCVDLLTPSGGTWYMRDYTTEYDCDWFAATPDVRCDKYGGPGMWANTQTGQTGQEVCCACGGGFTATPPPPPDTPAPSGGGFSGFVEGLSAHAFVKVEERVAVLFDGVLNFTKEIPTRYVGASFRRETAQDDLAVTFTLVAMPANESVEITFGGSYYFSTSCAAYGTGALLTNTSRVVFLGSRWHELAVDASGEVPRAIANGDEIPLPAACFPPTWGNTTRAGGVVFRRIQLTGTGLLDDFLACERGPCGVRPHAECPLNWCRDYACDDLRAALSPVDFTCNATTPGAGANYSSLQTAAQHCAPGHRGADCSTPLSCVDLQQTQLFPDLDCSTTDAPALPAPCHTNAACGPGSTARTCVFRRGP